MDAEEIKTEVNDALGGMIDPETGLSVIRTDLIHDRKVTSDGSVGLAFL